MNSTTVPNVLADRYASEAMRQLWSPQHKVVLERQLWLAVLRAQQRLGVPVPAGAIEDYERVVHQVDLSSIERREERTRHDVKARIEEFCELAGHELIHRGMTSRDLTENVEQLQVKSSLELLRNKAVTALARLAQAATSYGELPITGRSHNVAAQLTTLGKRFANAGEELLIATVDLESLIEAYPLRGIKGPVGTQQDQLDVLSSAEKVEALEDAVSEHLGFSRRMNAVGQVYPRSLDLRVVSALRQLASGPANLAKTVRLMAGHELAGEGFKKGQVGSSAMPHKMNARSCERISGLAAILTGHMNMVAALSGDQWNEGDVSCSVVRRVALPDSAFAMDGLLETFLHVLAGFAAFPPVIEAELSRYLPFLAVTKILMAATFEGIGREAAHHIIQRHALAVASDLREGRIQQNDLLDRLGADADLPLSAARLRALLANPMGMVGAAAAQVDRFAARVGELVARYPDAAQYVPGRLL